MNRNRGPGSHAEPSYLLQEPAVRDPELLGGTGPHPAGTLERGDDLLPLEAVGARLQDARRALRPAGGDVVGQEVLGDRRPEIGEQDRALELVGELANVAGEAVALERRERLRRRGADG